MSEEEQLQKRLRDLEALLAEAREVIAYFDSPYAQAMKGTEESARWVLRYDAIRARLNAERSTWVR